MNIAVIGIGGVGDYFGRKLTQLLNAEKDIWFEDEVRFTLLYDQ
jgi:ketopantoate reductase